MAKHKLNPEPELLPGDVPVEMPDLPKSLVVNTPEQLKAAGDPLRTRVLFTIQHQPMTAKQVADRLGATPGAIGHHLKVLEQAGLAQVVARRQMRGIIAKYYTRTARIFMFDAPSELEGNASNSAGNSIDVVGNAYAEWKEAQRESQPRGVQTNGFPHARLSPKRAKAYAERVQKLMDDLVGEPPDPNGTVFGLGMAFFQSPAYMQPAQIAQAKPETGTKSVKRVNVKTRRP